MLSKRLIIGFILVIILFSLFIYSSIENDKHDPDIGYILENFEKFNNTEIRLGGKIKDINLSKQIIIIKIGEPPYKNIEIDIENIDFEGEIGDIVEVLGVLDSPKHVTAKKILVTPDWKNTLIYVRSLPAIPFVLYLFFRAWKFNKKEFRFERREKRDA